MRCLGPLTRLQIQREPLKSGERPYRRYHPEAIEAVTRLRVGPFGCHGLTDQGWVMDVHHAEHPRTRQREGLNALSIGFTAHGDLMRQRFGVAMADGIAGESLIVQTPEPLSWAQAQQGLELRTAAGTFALSRLSIAHPCTEFAHCLLGLEPNTAEPQALKAALQFLDGGMRGFYGAWEGEAFELALGDELWGAT